MNRTGSTILGIGLLILGIVGFSTISNPWINWLDILAGLLSFGVATAGPQRTSVFSTKRRQQFGGGFLAISIGLFAMWIIGLATASVTVAMAWWNFAFACAFGVFAIGILSGRATLHEVSTTEKKEQDRRAA